MIATAYADDFVDASGWSSSSGISIAGGEVKASVDNSTVGKLIRTYESGIPPANNTVTPRLAFDFVVNKNMTAGTTVAVSLLESTSAQGNGVYLTQGVGISCGLYLTNPGFAGTTLMLAWASLVDGARYHVEMTINPTNFYGFYSLYDPSGNLVIRANTSAVAVDWYHSTRLVVQSNSATNASTVSRLAIDPVLTGSVTTGKYLTNTAKYTYFVPLDLQAVDYYLPGGGNTKLAAMYLHGAGQTPQFVEAPNYATGGAVMRAAILQDMLLIVPSIPASAGGGDSWGNDYGAAHCITAIAYGRSLIGNTSASLYFIAYSMGMLTAGRLIGNDGVLNVKGVYCLHGCCDIADLEQRGAFQAQIDSTWGVSAQPSYAAGLVTFARGNPLGLLTSNPGKFAGVAFFMDYSTTGDTIVPQGPNCVAFEAMLTTKNIAHRNSLKIYATHTETSTVGDSAAFFGQVGGSSGGGGRGGCPMAMVL